MSQEKVFPVSVPSSPTSMSAASVAERAFLARGNQDTVYTAPGARNRPRGSKEFDVSTWVEETTIVMLIKQLCEKSESLRRELLQHKQNDEWSHGTTTSPDRRSTDSQLSNWMKRWKNRY